MSVVQRFCLTRTSTVADGKQQTRHNY